MKNLSYQQVIHNLMWITFLFIFQKSLYKHLFMCYNINKLRDNNKINERLKGDLYEDLEY